MYTKAKMVGKRSPFTDQIWSYIKNCCILGIQVKEIFNEICRVYGNKKLSFSSITLWCKKFTSGVDSVKDVPHARRPKTATLQKIVEKVKNLVATDARFTTRHIAKCIGISVGAAHTILRHDLKMRRISARWIPHLLTKRTKTCSGKNCKTIVETVP